MRRIFITLQIFLAIVVTAQVAASQFESSGDGSVAADNDYFRVLKNTLGSDSSNTNIGTHVIVALTNVVIQSGRGETKLHRGQIAVFPAREKFHPPTGEFFEVAIKTNHPPLKRPEQWIEPTKNTIVYEDEEFRVFEERLAAGATRQLHSHAQRLVVRLNTVQLTDPRFHENARGTSGLQVANTVKFAEPVVHVVKNLSQESLFNIVIEFKLSRE